MLCLIIMFDVNGYPPQKSKHEEEKKVIDAHVMKQPKKKKFIALT